MYGGWEAGLLVRGVARREISELSNLTRERVRRGTGAPRSVEGGSGSGSPSVYGGWVGWAACL